MPFFNKWGFKVVHVGNQQAAIVSSSSQLRAVWRKFGGANPVGMLSRLVSELFFRDVVEKDEMVIADDSDQITCGCLLYTSPSPRDATLSRMPSSA